MGRLQDRLKVVKVAEKVGKGFRSSFRVRQVLVHLQLNQGSKLGGTTWEEVGGGVRREGECGGVAGGGGGIAPGERGRKHTYSMEC